MEPLSGVVAGGLLRLAPEVIKLLDRKNERKHEIQLGDQQYKLAELQSKSDVMQKDLEVEGAQFASGMEVLKTSIEAQGEKTGVRWIDAVSAAIRPAVTSWYFVIYSFAKSAQLSLATKDGVPFDTALLSIWTPFDQEMLAAVLAFWFVGRIWDRTTSRSFKQ